MTSILKRDRYPSRPPSMLVSAISAKAVRLLKRLCRRCVAGRRWLIRHRHGRLQRFGWSRAAHARLPLRLVHDHAPTPVATTAAAAGHSTGGHKAVPAQVAAVGMATVRYIARRQAPAVGVDARPRPATQCPMTPVDFDGRTATVAIAVPDILAAGGIGAKRAAMSPPAAMSVAAGPTTASSTTAIVTVTVAAVTIAPHAISRIATVTRIAEAGRCVAIARIRGERRSRIAGCRRVTGVAVISVRRS